MEYSEAYLKVLEFVDDDDPWKLDGYNPDEVYYMLLTAVAEFNSISDHIKEYDALDHMLTSAERSIGEALHICGCNCSTPLIGRHPDYGPRCRLCNVCVGEYIEDLTNPLV